MGYLYQGVFGEFKVIADCKAPFKQDDTAIVISDSVAYLKSIINRLRFVESYFYFFLITAPRSHIFYLFWLSCVEYDDWSFALIKFDAVDDALHEQLLVGIGFSFQLEIA